MQGRVRGNNWRLKRRLQTSCSTRRHAAADAFVMAPRAAALAVLFVALASLTCAEEDPASEELSRVELPCTPNTIFKMGCNTCLCNTDGNGALCTKDACPSDDDSYPASEELSRVELPCTPKRLFKMSCNTCLCNTDGRGALCTKDACPSDDDSYPASEELSSVEVPCTPNTTFKMSCNTCLCNMDGRGAACMKKACPSDHDWFVTACSRGPSDAFDCATCTCRPPPGRPDVCTSWDCRGSSRAAAMLRSACGGRSF